MEKATTENGAVLYPAAGDDLLLAPDREPVDAVGLPPGHLEEGEDDYNTLFGPL